MLCAALSCAAHAGEAKPDGTDPQLDKRVMEVSQELRCLVCQNQTIADSSAPLAADLRAQVREKLEQGMTQDEIVEYMVERYGEFVRYRPTMTAKTLLLWFGPAFALVLAVLLLVRRLRARAPAAPAALTREERARAAALLARGDEPKR
jgi:cytochrome c-type biogenesis protein CcmH